MSNKQKTKKDINWSELGFGYTKTDYRFQATWINGKWSEGELITSETMEIHEGAPALHYAQQCFEGLKAQTGKNGQVLLFRPRKNARRIRQSAKRIMMPAVPEELFMRGVVETVRANYAWIPPYGSGATLYIRPLLVGIGDNLGLVPAKKYEFRVFVCPVGPYYKGSTISLISLAVTGIDRAAPSGTGNVKVGANYSSGLLSTRQAKDLGADEALYLNATTREYLEEAGSANILIAMTGKRFATPKSDTILPSVTRDSIMKIAEKELKLTIEERPIHLRNEIDDFIEVSACGTAAVISPVGKIWFDNQWHKFYGNGKEVGPITKELYRFLTQLQRGEIEDSYGWTMEVDCN